MRKIIHIELLRVIAIIMVVLCHAVEEVYKWDVGFINGLSLQSRVFAFVAFTIGRLGVPIFMFVTGYLLLDRDYDNNGIQKFWKNNLLPLLITTEIWIVLYDVFLKFFHAQPFKWNILIKNVLFLEQVKLGHMWYMSMIIGMYLFLPLVARSLKNESLNLLMIPFVFSVVSLMIIPVISDILIATNKHGIYQVLCLNYSGGYYGLTIFIGYLYKRFGENKEISLCNSLVAGIVSFIFVVLLQIYYFGRGFSYAVWYHWFPLVFASSCITIVALKLSRRFLKEDNTFVLNLGKCAFGVYLVHFSIINDNE